jgi:hypothetical protein
VYCVSLVVEGKRGFRSSRFFTAKVNRSHFQQNGLKLEMISISFDNPKQGHYLKYFRNENVAGSADFCLGAVDLKLVEIVPPLPDSKEFNIIFPEGDNMNLTANTLEDAVAWVDALSELKEKALAGEPDMGLEDPGNVRTAAQAEQQESDDEGDYVVKQAIRGSVFVVNEPGQQVLSTRLLSREPEKINRVRVDKKLKPKRGTVNEVRTDALSTATTGSERKVRKRRSLTARACFSPSCSVFHMRDSPFCHDHAMLDPGSLKVSSL